MTDLDSLIADVQHNCHISDALFAREYSLCIYLLKMREYFRWEKGYPYGASLPDKEVGQWMSEREQLWLGLETQPFRTLRIHGVEYDPFDSQGIDNVLLPLGLAYSGGYGQGGKPLFCLAELASETHDQALHVVVTKREYARDLTSPPAMAQGTAIFVRKESLRRLLWERLEEWRWRNQEGPMARAARHYEFEADFESALDAMTDTEVENVILHEAGEYRVSSEIGPVWEEMLIAVARSRTEYVLRAVRDHFADCLVTLPHILEQERDASLHFYMANLTGMRRALFPSLLNAYDRWNECGDRKTIAHTVKIGAGYWREATHALTAQYREKPDAGNLGKAAEAVRL